jgi:electron transfer flavoprotein beta subunit
MKVVPFSDEVTVDQQTFTIDRTKARSLINPSDMNAIEMALQLKEKYNGKVILLSMGPPFFEKYMKLAISMGADEAILLSDRAFAGADTLATSYTLAKGIEKIGQYDIIICGEESSDGSTAQVPPGIAEWLNIPQITYVTEIEIDEEKKVAISWRQTNKGFEKIRASLPVVISVLTGCNEPRFMDYDRKDIVEKEYKITVWNAKDIEADPECIGFAGSPTSVVGIKTLKIVERKKKKIEGRIEEKSKELASIISKYL